MATGHTSSSTPKRAKRSVRPPVTTELSFRRAEGQFSYTVGARKEAVVPQKVGGQRNALLAKLDRLESQSVDGMQQQQQQDKALPCASILDSSG